MKKIKLAVSAIVVFLLMFAMAGCGQSEESSTKDDSWEKVKEAGVLKIGTEGAWAPFIYNDTKDNNKLVGFEVEWAESIAKHLGLKAEFDVSSQWDGVVAGLDAKRYDCIFCAVALTDYSADKYSFSDPYYLMRSVLVTDKDNTEVKDFPDLDGKIVGNSPQGVWGQIATANGADVRNMSLTQAVDNLKTGRIDATINAELSILDYVKTSGDKGIKIAKYYEPKDPKEEKVVVLFNKGNNALITEVNKAIKALLEDGTATKLSEKYFGKDIYKGVDLND